MIELYVSKHLQVKVRSSYFAFSWLSELEKEKCRRQQCIENENEKRTVNIAYLHADDRVDEEEHGNQQANVGKSLDGK